MKSLIVVCGIALLCILADRFGLFKTTRVQMEQLVVPFVASAGQARAIALIPQQFLIDQQYLLDKVANLEQQQAELIATQQRAITDQDELTTWKEHNQLSSKFVSTSLILANRPVLPIGLAQGILPGAMVIAHGTMIGSVTEVQPQLAFVELIEHAQNKLSVRVRELNAVGILERDGSTIILTNINSPSPLKKGQIVTTTGDGEGTVPFIPLGKILSVMSMPSEPFQRAELELLIHPANGMSVSVLQTGHAELVPTSRGVTEGSQ